MKTKVIHLAKCLQTILNVKSGDVWSICSENNIEFAITIQAAFVLAATIAPINHTYVEREAIVIFQANNLIFNNL